MKTPSILKNKRAIRIVFCRYADDWIILTNANLKISNQLKKRIEIWLKVNLKLTLSPEKTHTTCIKKKYAKFLGFYLYTYQSTKISIDLHGLGLG